MPHVLVVGGGVSGCSVAKTLAGENVQVTIIEKGNSLGGKVFGYGCKATEKCNNCGVCLTSGLWDDVSQNGNIKVLLNTKLTDLLGSKDNYSATIKDLDGTKYLTGITDVVVSTGFAKSTCDNTNSFVEVSGEGVMMGSELEQVVKARTGDKLFETEPTSVAFIQCYGSRDKKENAMYCSKVCCAYSTRAAKLIKQYYPKCEVSIFYMELQMVNSGEYFKELTNLGIEFIKCRPTKVSDQTVYFDNPKTSKRESKHFDLVVLSDGIHPSADANRVAEICGLGQDPSGFFKAVRPSAESGVYVVGCAKGPAKIEEVVADSVATAKKILC